MANSTPTLNGTTLSYITGISRNTKKYASYNRAANGTLTVTNRGTKREWELEFTDAPLSFVTSLRTIAALTATYTFVDEDGSSFTVFVDQEALNETVEQQSTTRVYNGTIKLLEV